MVRSGFRPSTEHRRDKERPVAWLAQRGGSRREFQLFVGWLERETKKRSTALRGVMCLFIFFEEPLRVAFCGRFEPNPGLGSFGA